MPTSLFDNADIIELIEAELEVRERHFVPADYVSLREALARTHERMFGSAESLQPPCGSKASPAGRPAENPDFCIDQLYKSRLWLRQQLFIGAVPVVIFSDSADYTPLPEKVWGSSDFSKIMSSGFVSTWNGQRVISGRVLILQGSLNSNLEQCPLQIGFTTANCNPEVQLASPALSREAKSRRSRGRPREWDWDSIFREIIQLANTPDGLPEHQGELEKWVASRCLALFGSEPATSTIREKVSPIYQS